MKKILPIILVLAVLAIAYVLTQQEAPDVPASASGKGGTVTFVSDKPKVLLVLEAENAEKIEPPVSIAEGIPGASGEKCCYIGPEKVNENPETAKYDKGYPGAAYPGYARLACTVPETENYYVWVRVRWSDNCGDSLDVALDGKFFGTVQGNAAKGDPKWIWLRVGGKRIPLTVRLEKDKPHSLTLANREDNLHFDQVVLVDDSVAFEPRGIQKPLESSPEHE